MVATGGRGFVRGVELSARTPRVLAIRRGHAWERVKWEKKGVEREREWRHAGLRKSEIRRRTSWGKSLSFGVTGIGGEVEARFGGLKVE